ncbi:MAG TPA: hypothetical protein PKA00_12030 [Saprospiraceae bacterium]|nr:hypothetical protein [Saprospiraceae bacterium]HMQ83634.1 hypothetical protein [Saprospiraceae bacterium]
MEELNRQTLVQALQQLPEHAPPASLWEDIVLTLEQESWMEEKLADLPVYAPPASIWENIEKDLDRPAVKKRYLLPQRWVAAAAAVLLLLLSTWWMMSPKATEQVSLAYEQEQMDMDLLEADWEQDEPDIQMVVQRFQKSIHHELHPEKALLETEYQELDEARQEILLMMERYGKDAALIKQLSEVERERSKVVRKMAQALSA